MKKINILLVLQILLVLGSAFFLIPFETIAGNIDVILEADKSFNVKKGNVNEDEVFSVSSDGLVTINNEYTLRDDIGEPGQAMITQNNDTVGWINVKSGTNNGYGSSSLTKYLSDKGLFALHENNCGLNTGVWDFITVIDRKPPYLDLGFCIETEEHDADSFEDAQMDCMNKPQPARLPEPVEWKLACIQEYSNKMNNNPNASYLNNYEWVSNFIIIDAVDEVLSGVVPVAGDGVDCNNFSKAWIFYSVANITDKHHIGKMNFRCVR